MLKKIKSFYTENMKLIHKFLLNQVAISIFGFTVILATSALSPTAMMISTVFASLFFVSLLYDSAWEEGERDRNRILNGRLEKRPLHGMKVALFAYIPTFLFVIPAFILTLFAVFGIRFWRPVLMVCTAVSLFVCNGMYLGFSNALAGVFPTGYVLFTPLFLIPGILAYTLGYYLGIKDIQLKTFIGMKPTTGSPEKKKKRK